MPYTKDVLEFELRDDAMFTYVMRNLEVVKLLLQRVLGREIRHVQFHDVQETNEASVDSRGVRFDVYIEGENEVYDIEMQLNPKQATGRRARFYASTIDASYLRRGEHYSKLPEVYIIYFTTVDPLGEGRAVQEFTVMSKETYREYDFGLHYLFYNMNYIDANVTEEMREFLDYLRDPRGTAATSNDLLVRVAEHEVCLAKTSSDRRREVMLLSVKMSDKYDEGYDVGVSEGAAKKDAAWKQAMTMALQGKSPAEIYTITGCEIDPALCKVPSTSRSPFADIEEVITASDAENGDASKTQGNTGLQSMQLT